jgi:hypothetical protein
VLACVLCPGCAGIGEGEFVGTEVDEIGITDEIVIVVAETCVEQLPLPLACKVSPTAGAGPFMAAPGESITWR